MARHSIPESGYGQAGPHRVGQPRATARPETVRLYAVEWLAFVAWCRVAKRVALPAADETLAAYLLASATGAARGTLGRKRAAIRAMHRQHNLPMPTLDGAARAALRRATPPRPRPRPAPASPSALVQLAVRCSRDLAGLRDRALLLLAATELMSREELLGLEREQLRLVEAGAELRLSRAGPVTVLVARSNAAACPVRALEDWLSASDTQFGPVFRKIDRWGNIEHARLGPDALLRIADRRTGKPGGRSKRA